MSLNTQQESPKLDNQPNSSHSGAASSLIKRLSRAHTLHFLALGALGFVLTQQLFAPAAVIELDGELLQQQQLQLQQEIRQPLTQAQQQQLLKRLSREQMLVDLALQQGLEQSPIVTQRLMRLGQFLQLDSPELNGSLEPDSSPEPQNTTQVKSRLAQSNRAAVAAARALGLERSDPVIRRFLQSAFERRLLERLPASAPTEQQLQDYYTSRGADYTQPARLSFRQVFFQAEHAERAQVIGQQLRSGELDFDAALALSNGFISGWHQPLLSAAKHSAYFGREFADQLWRQTAEQWSTPLRSAYGWHLVFIEEQRAEQPQSFAQLKAKLLPLLQRQQRDAALDSEIDRLHSQYQISVDGLIQPLAATTASTTAKDS